MAHQYKCDYCDELAMKGHHTCKGSEMSGFLEMFDEEQMKKALTEQCKASTIEPKNILTLDTLLEAKMKLNRDLKLYVTDANYLPDDCVGVLYMRKEDAEKWGLKK